MKHKTEDYKISAVKYYLNNEVSMDEVCEIFECKKTSLKRWIDRYEKDDSIKRHSRKSISYKITNEHVKYAIKLLKKNEQITLEELSKLVKKKYKDFDITSRQLGNILRDNNKTRKRTRHEHFPKIRYGKIIDKQKELTAFYNDVDKYPINKIISFKTYPRGGNSYTPGSTGSGLNQSSGASFRVIIDTKDWDNSIATNSPGQSGDPSSPFYRNLYESWANDEYFKLLYSKDLIAKNAYNKIVYYPKK